MVKEHLASFDDAFGDGEETYNKEVEERQKTPKSRGKRLNLRKIIEESLKRPKGVISRSEQRDKVAEKIKAAKTHDEKMAIAKEYHESVSHPDEYAFPQKWQREQLLKENRTALKFKKQTTR